MKPRNLFNKDDRGVSPVIGVILMVAITVILAAVIGTFVLGLGDSLGDSQPTAQLNVEASGGTLTIEHGGGDRLDANDLTVQVSSASSGNSTNTSEFGSAFTVGDSATASYSTSGSSTDDVRVQIIHTPSDSIILDQTLTVDSVGGGSEFDSLTWSTS